MYKAHAMISDGREAIVSQSFVTFSNISNIVFPILFKIMTICFEKVILFSVTSNRLISEILIGIFPTCHSPFECYLGNLASLLLCADIFKHDGPFRKFGNACSYLFALFNII